MAQDALIRIRAKVSGQREVKNLERQFKQTEDRTKSLKRSFGSLRGAVAGLGVTLGAVQAIKFTIASTAELETQTRSLEVLTGSLKSAKTVISELQAFGAVTPFTSAELIDTAKRLRAFGVDTEKLVATTKRLGDVAGATGADLGGVATAFGQIVAKGRLQGEELLQLQERGINLQDELQKMYGLTAEEFRKALEGGKISAEAVEVALKNVTDAGGKYANGAIAQSDTLAGRFSTLQDNVTRLAQSLGNVLAPVLKQITNLAIDALNTINKQFEAAALADNLGLKGPALDRITAKANKQAEELVQLRFPGIGGSFEKSAEYNKLFLERFNDLIKEYGYSTGLLQAEVQKISEEGIKIPDLLGGTTPTANGKNRVDISNQQLDIGLQILEATEKGQSLQLIELQLAEKLLELDRQKLKPNRLFLKQSQAISAARLQQIQLAKDAGKAMADMLIKDQDRIDLIKKGIEDLNKDLADMIPAITPIDQLFKDIGQSITANVAGAIEATIFEAQTLQESLSGILRSVASLLINFGTKSLLGGLFPSADGNVFAQNKIVPFANGGIINRPTIFPLANGAALAGEAGPEAIMPLRRDASGRLGVEASGGGVTVGAINITVENTGDQLNPAAQKQIAGQVQGLVLSTLANERRSGGMLG